MINYIWLGTGVTKMKHTRDSLYDHYTTVFYPRYMNGDFGGTGLQVIHTRKDLSKYKLMKAYLANNLAMEAQSYLALSRNIGHKGLNRFFITPITVTEKPLVIIAGYSVSVPKEQQYQLWASVYDNVYTTTGLLAVARKSGYTVDYDFTYDEEPGFWQSAYASAIFMYKIINAVRDLNQRERESLSSKDKILF